MLVCPNGHGNTEGQRFCGQCAAPLTATSAGQSRLISSTLRPGDRVKVVAPKDDHAGKIGTVFELFSDGSGVCVKFSGDAEPYAFEFHEVKPIAAVKHSVAKISAPGPVRQPPTPGWYPDPLNPGKQSYWDGAGWGEPVGVRSDGDISKKTAVAAGVCVLVAIGFVMSMQSVSLLTGSGLVWTGVAVVGAGTAVAFFLRAALWVRVLAAVFLALALFNALYIESQMTEKRNEISEIFDN